MMAFVIAMLAVLETAPINIGYPWKENIVAKRAIVLVLPQPGGPLINAILSLVTN